MDGGSLPPRGGVGVGAAVNWPPKFLVDTD